MPHVHAEFLDLCRRLGIPPAPAKGRPRARGPLPYSAAVVGRLLNVDSETAGRWISGTQRVHPSAVATMRVYCLLKDVLEGLSIETIQNAERVFQYDLESV